MLHHTINKDREKIWLTQQELDEFKGMVIKVQFV